jgi:hypothetical protein
VPVMKIIVRVAVAISLFLPGVLPAAMAQCSMCRTTAALTAGVFDSAIIVLFIPAIALFSGVFFLAFRYWPDNEEDSGSDWPAGRAQKEIGGESLRHERQ